MAASGTGPIRHVVLAKLKDRSYTQAVVDNARRMENGLPGVTFLSFNVVADLGFNETNANVSVIADFPDKENLIAYAQHPQHIAILAQNQEQFVSRLVIQYDLPAKV